MRKNNRRKPKLLQVPAIKHARIMLTLLVVLTAAVGYEMVRHSLASSCAISSNLVNSCRPLYGTSMATITPYSQAASDQVSQMKYQDQRIGHTSDIAHIFNSPGHNVIPPAGTTLINDGYTLMMNWKPASPWVNGSNGSDNTAIDAMAASLKSVAPHKVMLVIWHEPENDVSPGGADCTVSKGSEGTAAQYVAMWQYTVTRLRADGVTNAVYVEYFQNYPPLTCNNINQLYAGDNYVDWIGFDDYEQYGTFSSWDSVVSDFYNFLTTNSNSSHNYLSKPWMISEMGVANFSVADEETWYEQAATAITNNTFPNLKAIVDFDDNNPATGVAENRQAYDDAGAFVQAKQNAYNTLVNAIYNKGPVSTPTPTPTPTPKPTSTPTPKPTPNPTKTPTPAPEPTSSASPPPTLIVAPTPAGAPPPTISGTITLASPVSSGSTASTQCFVDSKPLQSCSVNTAALGNGLHTVEVKTVTTSGKVVTQEKTVNVKNPQSFKQRLVAALRSRTTYGVVVIVLAAAAYLLYPRYRFKLISYFKHK